MKPRTILLVLLAFLIGLGANALEAQVGWSGSRTRLPYLYFPSGGFLNFNAGDVTLTHSANALTFDGLTTIGLGAPAAAPADVTIAGVSVLAGTSNIQGGDLTIAGGIGRGTGRSGDIIFQTHVAGSSGDTAGTLATAMTIASGAVTVTGAVSASTLNMTSAGFLTNTDGGIMGVGYRDTAIKFVTSYGERARIDTTGNVTLELPKITAGSGTGVTVNNTGSLQRLTHKVTVTYAAFSAAATTADKTIATLPAKTRLVSIITDTTIAYTGGAVSAATLMVGKSAGGAEYMAVHDVLSAAIVKGLADADLGTSMTRAAAIQGGDLPSWTATTDISVRLTTTTADTDKLAAGSTTYYITTEKMP